MDTALSDTENQPDPQVPITERVDDIFAGLAIGNDDQGNQVNISNAVGN